MARELFPRTRHLALSRSGQPGLANAEGAEAICVPIEGARGAISLGQLPHPEQEGAPGVPAKGDLPAATNEVALQAGVHDAPGAAQALPEVVAIDLALPAAGDGCKAIDGSESGVRCASSAEGRDAAQALAARAAQAGDAVLLDGLDRWYARGPEGAGYCRSCELALSEGLRESFGEHFQPYEALAALRAPGEERPFARQREALRFSEAAKFAKHAVLAARDEARRSRSVEIAVLGRVSSLSGLSLFLARHLDGLLFPLPSLDPIDALLPLQAARAALGQRPAVALLPPEASVLQVRQLAAIAAACDCDVALDPAAPAEVRAALLAQRQFLAVARERFRPVAPLADAELLVSPSCDHRTQGEHLRAAAQCMPALATAQLQPAVRLDLAGGIRAPLVILAGASALPSSDANAARKFVEGGGDALVIGRCAAVDEEGRAQDPLFPEAKAGLARVGEGRVWAAPDAAQLVRALRELGRKPQISVAGRGKLLARTYLDAERKLDVHLVNLEVREQAFVAAQGVQLSIAGSAAGGGRSGYWFAQERASGRDGERITLNPSGFAVSTILPSLDAYALLAVPR